MTMGLLAALAGFRAEPADSQSEDRDCLRRLVSGDTAAAGPLYDRHARAIYSLALRILDDEGDAEGVVQDVFVQASRQAARDEPVRGDVGAWLLMMARTRAIDTLRARRARSGPQTIDDPHAAGEVPARPDAASELLDGEAARQVQRALAELPLLQRLAVELAYYEGLTQREVAERLEEPLGTVRTRIRTGIMKLRETLAEVRP